MTDDGCLRFLVELICFLVEHLRILLDELR